VKPAPVLASLDAYPFTRLTEAKRRVAAAGVPLIDFGIGEPREETPTFIREALAAAIEPQSRYPLAEGLPELRDAIEHWLYRRFGAVVDGGTQVIPTLGAKEAIFHLAQVVGGDAVAVTSPGYPVAARGARFAGRDVVTVPLAEDWLPDLDVLPWERLGILWLNYPNNPTAAVASQAFYEDVAARCRRHDVILASDEAYSELYFGPEPPASAIQVSDLRNVVVVNTLSKRSSMPGYRSGFVAGDADVIAALRRYRPNVGVAPQEFVQRAAIAAWGDEEHVAAVRELYRAKRDVLLDSLEAVGLRHVGGDATFFLWLAGGAPDLHARLLERGVVLAPGEFFGPGGGGHLRLALVPTLDDCHRAAEIIAALA
jgi:aspartate/methionine/tyrosine aminotransferase